MRYHAAGELIAHRGVRVWQSDTRGGLELLKSCWVRMTQFCNELCAHSLTVVFTAIVHREVRRTTDRISTELLRQNDSILQWALCSLSHGGLYRHRTPRTSAHSDRMCAMQEMSNRQLTINQYSILDLARFSYPYMCMRPERWVVLHVAQDLCAVCTINKHADNVCGFEERETLPLNLCKPGSDVSVL